MQTILEEQSNTLTTQPPCPNSGHSFVYELNQKNFEAKMLRFKKIINFCSEQKKTYQIKPMFD